MTLPQDGAIETALGSSAPGQYRKKVCAVPAQKSSSTVSEATNRRTCKENPSAGGCAANNKPEESKSRRTRLRLKGGRRFQPHSHCRNDRDTGNGSGLPDCFCSAVVPTGRMIAKSKTWWRRAPGRETSTRDPTLHDMKTGHYRACALASDRVAPDLAASAAAMNSSRSPSSTASGLPFSTPVRRSFTS